MVPVASIPNPGDEAALARHARALADAIEAAIPGWVERCTAAFGVAAGDAATRARDAVMPEVRRLLATDVDEQRANPLALLRAAVRFPTEVLRDAGAAPVPRDEFAVRSFPDDVYDLSPAAFADVDPALTSPGITWGAAKAHVVLARRRAEGLR
jgi:hypothetical protein